MLVVLHKARLLYSVFVTVLQSQLIWACFRFEAPPPVLPTNPATFQAAQGISNGPGAVQFSAPILEGGSGGSSGFSGGSNGFSGGGGRGGGFNSGIRGGGAQRSAPFPRGSSGNWGGSRNGFPSGPRQSQFFGGQCRGPGHCNPGGNSRPRWQPQRPVPQNHLDAPPRDTFIWERTRVEDTWQGPPEATNFEPVAWEQQQSPHAVQQSPPVEQSARFEQPPVDAVQQTHWEAPVHEKVPVHESPPSWNKATVLEIEDAPSAVHSDPFAPAPRQAPPPAHEPSFVQQDTAPVAAAVDGNSCESPFNLPNLPTDAQFHLWPQQIDYLDGESVLVTCLHFKSGATRVKYQPSDTSKPFTISGSTFECDDGQWLASNTNRPIRRILCL